jgi:glycosyltransferase involved in cell wall biosynthesis
MSELRVLHVIPAIAARYGGPSRAIFDMCRALRMRGADILLATTDADGPAHLDVIKERVIAYQEVPTIFFSRQWSERFGYSHSLARWLDQEVRRFDVVHIHAVFSHPCLAAARACQKRDVPYIIRPLGSLDPWSMRQKAFVKKVMWHLAVRRMLHTAAAIHYTTNEERQLAESSLGLDNGVVIPLGIEMEDQQEQGGDGLFRERHPLLGKSPYLLTLSRLHPKKNIELLLEVFLSLAGRGQSQDWRLVIAGDGEAAYVDSLKRLVRQKGGEDRVLFTGWLDGAEKVSALRNAALLALPSHQENFGLAAAEALACGVPVVVSEHVNLAPEIEKYGAGWVTSLDAASLANALSEAMGNESERQERGASGRAFAIRHFSWSNLSVDLERLYIAVSNKGTGVKSVSSFFHHQA